MTPERADKMRHARETLFSDDVSSRIFSHFLSLQMQAGGQGFYLDEALKDPRWLMKESLVKAFGDHKARYLGLLKDALPDFTIREKVKPVIADEGAKIRVYASLEELPARARVLAKARNDGKFQISEADLMSSLGGEVADPGAAPPKTKERGQFEISSAEVSADFGKYTAIRRPGAKIDRSHSEKYNLPESRRPEISRSRHQWWRNRCYA
jgi:hypothetical protein